MALAKDTSNVKDENVQVKKVALKYKMDALISAATNRPVKEGEGRITPHIYWCEACSVKMTHPMSAVGHFSSAHHFRKAKAYVATKAEKRKQPAAAPSKAEPPAKFFKTTKWVGEITRGGASRGGASRGGASRGGASRGGAARGGAARGAGYNRGSTNRGGANKSTGVTSTRGVRGVNRGMGGPHRNNYSNSGFQAVTNHFGFPELQPNTGQYYGSQQWGSVGMPQQNTLFPNSGGRGQLYGPSGGNAYNRSSQGYNQAGFSFNNTQMPSRVDPRQNAWNATRGY